jgi:hypothetical protein
MKTEEKTALLNEVINKINLSNTIFRYGSYYVEKPELIESIQSLLPKEEAIPDSQIKEPVKPEPTQEIKAGDEVEAFVEVDSDKGIKDWVKCIFYAKSIHPNRCWFESYVVAYIDTGRVDEVTEIRKPLQKTQEEMDREKGGT